METASHAHGRRAVRTNINISQHLEHRTGGLAARFKPFRWRQVRSRGIVNNKVLRLIFEGSLPFRIRPASPEGGTGTGKSIFRVKLGYRPPQKASRGRQPGDSRATAPLMGESRLRRERTFVGESRLRRERILRSNPPISQRNANGSVGAAQPPRLGSARSPAA